MNIIELAREAGFPERRAFSDLSDLYPRLERFAALVRAAALDEAEQKCDDLWQDDGTAYDCREAILALKEDRSRPQNTPSSGESHEDSLKSGEEGRKLEPVAYIHRQGNHWEVAERHLTNDEKDRGWTEVPLYTHVPDDTALLRQALEALEACLGWPYVIAALRDRLGETK